MGNHFPPVISQTVARRDRFTQFFRKTGRLWPEVKHLGGSQSRPLGILPDGHPCPVVGSYILSFREGRAVFAGANFQSRMMRHWNLRPLLRSSSASRAVLRQAAISSGLKNLIFVIALCVGVVLMAVFDQIVSGLIMEYGPD